MSNKIEAVVICVNYSDFLKITLSKNAHNFDHIVIITSHNDNEIEKITSSYSNISLIKTDAFYYNGASFNKGLAIDVGFQSLKYKDWVVNLDADIVLPTNFKEKFLQEANDIECSYSAQRYNIETYEEWLEINKNILKLKNKLLYRGIGYGYFFCFNYKSKIFQHLLEITNGFPYPNWLPNVAESDWIFRNYWSDWVFDPPLTNDQNQHNINYNDKAQNPSKLKQLSFNVIHLGETGRNEKSRITPKWEI